MTETNGQSIDGSKMTATNGHGVGVKGAEQPKLLDASLSHKEEQQLSEEPLREEEAPSKFDDASVKKRRKSRRRRCCFCCLASVVVVAVIIVILVFTVFKQKDPKINVNSVMVEGINSSYDPAAMRLKLNLTIVADMSLKNPNKAASFKHADSTTVIFYGGSNIGQAVIPAGKIKADKTVRVNVTMTLYVETLMSSGSSLITDGLSGSLEMSTRTVMSGRVKLIGIIKKHVTVYALCNVTVNLSTTSTTAEVENCSSKFKL